MNNGAGRSEFSYDGRSRRIRIVEKTNGATTSDTRFLWCGENICEQRDSTGATTTARYFAQGEQQGTNNFFYTTDHLGSVREMVDTTGTIRARYDYDPYGRVTKVSGDLNASFTYASYYIHSTSGLLLTHFRAYDPNLGRWLSQDPLGISQSTNVYAYASNMPITNFDPLGLWSPSAHDLLFDVGLSGVAPASDIAALKAASRSWDEKTGLSIEWSNSHYMARPLQSSESARLGAQSFVDTRILLAQLALESGNRCDALRLLGEAMHTIEDSSSPVHAGANGLPRTWPYNIWSHSPGWYYGSETETAITPQVYDSQRQLLTAAYRRVFSQ